MSHPEGFAQTPCIMAGLCRNADDLTVITLRLLAAARRYSDLHMGDVWSAEENVGDNTLVDTNIRLTFAS